MGKTGKVIVVVNGKEITLDSAAAAAALKDAIAANGAQQAALLQEAIAAGHLIPGMEITLSDGNKGIVKAFDPKTGKVIVVVNGKEITLDSAAAAAALKDAIAANGAQQAALLQEGIAAGHL